MFDMIQIELSTRGLDVDATMPGAPSLPIMDQVFVATGECKGELVGYISRDGGDWVFCGKDGANAFSDRELANVLRWATGRAYCLVALRVRYQAIVKGDHA